MVMRASIALSMTYMGLRLFGFRRWKDWTKVLLRQDARAPGFDSHGRPTTAALITRAMRSAEFQAPLRPSCLDRSFALWSLLRRYGIAGELHIGACKTDDRFAAHAWVELDGEVLNDSADVHQHYSRFDAPIATADGNSR